ncbi:MAG TPA: hypothetical protein VIL40_00130 [Thermaerobacter sp.]
MAVRALWQACGWEVPAGSRDRPVRRGELARWLVRGLIRPAPEPLADSAALAIAAGMGWLPPAWAGPTDGAPDRAFTGMAQVAVTRDDLQAIATAVLTPPTPRGEPPAEGGARGSSAASSAQGARFGGGSPEDGAAGDGVDDTSALATLGEAMTWYLGLLERVGRLFDGEGIVTAVDRHAGRVWVSEGALRWVLAVPPGTPVYHNGQGAGLEVLAPGDEVRWRAAPADRAGRPDAGGGPRPAGDGATATPIVTVSYLEGFRWVLEGAVTRVDWEARTLTVEPAPAATPGAGAAAIAPRRGTFAGIKRPRHRDRDAATTGILGPARPPSPWAPAPPGGGTGRVGRGVPAVALITLPVEPMAPVVLNARSAGLAALRPGDRVVLDLRRATGAVRRIQATRAAVVGHLDRVDVLHGVIAVRTARGPILWAVDAAAPVLRDGRRSRLADLRPGDAVWLGQRRPGLAGYVEARSTEAAGSGAPGDPDGTAAAIPAVSASQGHGQARAGAPGAGDP